jgi:hypothetical protein
MSSSHLYGCKPHTSISWILASRLSTEGQLDVGPIPTYSLGLEQRASLRRNAFGVGLDFVGALSPYPLPGELIQHLSIAVSSQEYHDHQ